MYSNIGIYLDVYIASDFPFTCKCLSVFNFKQLDVFVINLFAELLIY